MARSRDSDYMTVSEAAEFLGTSTETVRRKIKAYELPAQRASEAPQAPWLVHRPTLERRMERERFQQRVRERGIVVAYDDAEFADKVEERHGRDAGDAVRDMQARRELFARVERDMYADPSVRRELERLDEKDRFEHEAREIARRVRRAERLRDRANEILESEDLDPE